MAWDTALAQAIKGTSRAEANRKPQPWYRAEVVQVTPKLIFAIADKEFRYLRTVIVTAAVYWGLNSHLRLTSKHSS